MALSNWLPTILKVSRRGIAKKRRLMQRPMVQALEDRTVPSTFWVTNRNDAGAGSLRQAVLDANAHAGADAIAFRHSAEGTITLTSGELSITGDSRIDGPGADDETVSGGGTSRVFNIAAGAVVRIDDLTIANGHVQGANGGGILNAGNLTLTESVVAGNVALGNGGGIANTGTLTASHAKFSGNAANNGGGIVNSGTLTVYHSEITENHGGYYGGGLLNTGVGAMALLDHVAVIGNTGHDAAGITNGTNPTLTIQNSLITGNHADVFGTGAINSYGPLNIFNTTISENSGSIPAIWLPGQPTVDVVIRGSRIVHNRLGPPGPPLEFAPITSSVHLRIEDTTISENIGDQAGALMLEFGTTEIVNSTISGNVGGANDSYSVGAIFAFGQLTVVDSTISNNTGAKAGGLYNSFFGSYDVVITNSTISGNKAIPVPGGPYGYMRGAGAITSYGPTTINNSTISGNTVVADGMVPNQYPSAAAGGVLASYSSLTIDHSTIAFNTVTNAPPDLDQVSGGVVGIQNDPFTPDVNVRNTIIAKNSATDWDPDVSGPFQSQGHNLIGVLTANATGFVASDVRGTAAVPLDPRLKPLGHNGGRTMTHALRHDSPAVNAGDNADAPPTDQRGHTRIVGGTIDIGSYEADFGGGEGPMARITVDLTLSQPDPLLLSDQAGPSQNRLPKMQFSMDSDEQFGSRRDTPTWFWMGSVSTHAGAEEPIDSLFTSREFDTTVLVGPVT
jgi:hypothetical protein